MLTMTTTTATAARRATARMLRAGPARPRCPVRRAAYAGAMTQTKRSLVTAMTVYSAEQWPRWKSSFAPRHGKAIEPVPLESESAVGGSSDEGLDQVKIGEQTKSVVKMEQPETPEEEQEMEAEEEEVSEAEEKEKHHPDPAEDSVPEEGDQTNLASSTDTAKPDSLDERTRQVKEEAKQSGPLEAVMNMESPGRVAKQHPSMSPSRYIHHFDSYSLVKQLQEGGYTTAQAIESMKGVRAILAQNLDVAQESLVSKSDVENEAYLFEAACSELGQEIKNNRRLQDEQVRQQRTHLQHEVDILQQSLNQEVVTLNDNIRGMFNDRRMAVREDEKTADSTLQQINYKISTSLVSDIKSEIEGVRWVLIRRSAIGIFFMAMVTLAAIRYTTYLHSEAQKEDKRLKEQEEKEKKERGRLDNTSAADAAAILSAN